MKLECKIDKIKSALLYADRMTGKNLTLPVLGAILWIVKGNTLTVRSTNLSIGIEIVIPVKVEKEGIVAIRGDVLSSLFSVLVSDGAVSFELIENTLLVKTKNSKIQLKTISPDDFPTLPVVVGDSFSLDIQKFTQGVKSVFYSASVSEIKPEIGSVYMYSEQEMLFFVATDSFRLAEKKVNIKKNLNINSILVPFKNITEIVKVFEGVEGTVDVVCNKNQISFSCEGIYITSRVVDGVFPDYKQILPKTATTTATILKQDFLSALKVSNALSDKFNQITLHIKPKEKVFEIESKNNDVGENTTMVSAALTGDDVSLHFNVKYITDCFQSISSDSLVLELNGSSKPMLIKPVGDPLFMYVVMPMNK